MKKIILVLAVLMVAAPAMAVVIIDANQVSDTDQVDITATWSGTGEANTPRAFGLDVTVDNGQTITGISNFFSGEGAGYGIFPASFSREIDADDPNWADVNYTPVADACDLPGDTQGGIGTGGITIELGSLYQDTNVPTSGSTLCIITVSGDCNVDFALNVGRGGIVMEDGSAPDTLNLFGTTVTIPPSGCYTGPDLTEWQAVGEPTSWCSPKQCHGDATGSDEEFGRGNFVSVGLADVLVLLDGYNDNTYVDPDTDPWIAADFTHSDEEFGRGNFVRVGLADVLVLLDFYNDEQSTVPADCNP